MSATTEQKFEELRRAYEELREEHDAALAELQARTRRRRSSAAMDWMQAPKRRQIGISGP